MEQDGPMEFPVGPGIFQLEALWQREIALDRPALPAAAQDIVDLDVDLRPVERALTRMEGEGELADGQRLAQRRLGMGPGVLAADALVRARGELQLVVGQPK